MIHNVRTLYNHRELLWTWIWRDIRVRYKQSLLGGLWAILQPVSLMLMFTLVFSIFAPLPTETVPYPIFSYTALLPWTFFATSITFSVTSLTNNMHLITKIYFPREILPLAAVGTSLLDMGIASIILVGLMLFYQVPFSLTMLLFPLLLLVQIALTLGIAFFASAINVFYRDIRFIVPLSIQLWMYASPIIYPLKIVPAQYLPLYMLNPMAGLIEGYRSILLHGQLPNWTYLGLSAGISAVLVLAGYTYFKHVEPRFADVI